MISMHPALDAKKPIVLKHLLVLSRIAASVSRIEAKSA